MKKKITIRFVSVVLCLAMMFACLQVSATALTLEDVEQVFNKLAHYTVDDLPKNLRRHLNSGWSRSTLDKADADNENVLTTVNADGTKTLYSYDSPIKFVDEEGYVRFIDSSLKPCVKADGLFDWYSYENTANDIKTYFPLFIKTGVLVEGEQGDIRMTPKDARNSLSSKVDEGNNEYVLYEDVFDKGVDIRYTAINEGVKEDIILEAYNGDNTFEYIVEAEGLTPVRNEGKTVEFIDGDMQTAYTLGEIVMFDSAEVPATNGNNSYTVEKLKDGKYLVTLVIDEEFLTDENTVYPVVVDPTVGEDTAVNCFEHETYAFGEDEGEGIQLFSYIGVSETEYEFITYMQLTDMSEFVDINPSNVNSASFTIYSNNATPSYNVELFACNFDDEVAVDELTQSYIQYAIDNKRFTNTQTITNSLTVDISDYFVDWLTVKTKSYKWEDTLSAEDGFFIKAAGSDYSSYPLKQLYMQYVNDDILAPSITVNYTEDVSLDTGYYYIQSGYYYDDARYLTATDDDGVVIYDYTGAANQIWYVAKNNEYNGDPDLIGRYRIYSVSGMEYINSSLESVGLDNTFSEGMLYNTGFTYKILDQSNGYKRIISSADGYKKTLGVKWYLKDNNSPIVLQDVKGLDNQRWKFKPVEKLAIPVGDDTINMVVGEQKYLSYTLINGAEFISADSDKRGVVNVENGYLVAKSKGTATITVTAKVPINNNGGYLTRETKWTVYVNSSTPTGGIQSGNSYFMQSYENGLFAGFSSSSNRVTAQELSNINNKPVCLNYIYDGEYELTMSNGSQDMLVTVDSSNNVVLQADQNFNNQRWYINKESNGYSFVNKSVPYMYLYIDTDADSGTSLVLSTTKSCWNIKEGTAIISAEAYDEGVRYAEKDGKIYYDFTEPFEDLFRYTSRLCGEQCVLSWEDFCAAIGGEQSKAEHITATASSFLWFLSRVKHGAIWDIKEQSSWEYSMPNIPYVGKIENTDDYYSFIYRGELQTAHTMGNILYGYNGAALGLSDVTLYWGGGVANLKCIDDPSLKDPEQWYGDKEDDHYEIERGYNMYFSEYGATAVPTAFYGIPLDPEIIQVCKQVLVEKQNIILPSGPIIV